MTSLGELAVEWRARAEQLERFAPAAATAFRDCAVELERAVDEAASAELTLTEAAMASGYSKEHIRHEVAAGRIPNAGTKGRPRVRAADLPRKARRAASAYDPDADARRLLARVGP